MYVSGHGFGHAVRCAELCRALLGPAPELHIQARTAAPAWIFPPGVEVVSRRLDVGVVQPDSLHVDPAATLARYAAHVRDEDALIAAEAAEIESLGARLVVADIPSAAFAVAERAGLPGLGVANFSWDWIYAPYVADAPSYAPLLDRRVTRDGREEPGRRGGANVDRRGGLLPLERPDDLGRADGVAIAVPRHVIDERAHDRILAAGPAG